MMAAIAKGLEFCLLTRNPAPSLPASFAIEQAQTTVGRHPSNTIPLPFDSISRFHARLELRGRDMHLVDLDSSNGSFINQKRVTDSILCDGDIITFGNIQFVFQCRQSAEPPEATTRTHAGVRLVNQAESSLHTIIRKVEKTDPTAAHKFPEEITDASSLARARKLLDALYEFHKQLGSKSEEDNIYATTLDVIFHALPCERGVILAREDEQAPFKPVQIKTRGQNAQADSISISQTIIDHCLTDRVAILSRDATTDSRFANAHSIMMHDIRSAMCAPMISREKILAICFVDTSEATSSFDEPDLAFFASLAAEVAILIDNARMRIEMMRNQQMAAIGQTITGMAHNVKNILMLSQGGIGLMDMCLDKKNYDCWSAHGN